MKLIVNPHKIEIDKSPVNEREIDISKCEFEFADEITNDYVKEAYFTFKGTTYKQIIVNNECAFPSEVLTEKGTVEIGVVAYKVEDEETIKRYNPSPAYFNTWDGSLKDNAENSEPITPSEMEQYEQALQDGLEEVNGKLDEIDQALTDVNTAIIETNNLDLDVNKTGKVATVTLTKKDASTKTVTLSDGTSLMFNWDGTKLGIKTDEDTEYTYVDLQGIQGPIGPQGEAFQIKKTYSSVAEMNADFDNMELGDYVMIASTIEQEDNAKLYTRGAEEWIFISDFSGAVGIQGETGLTPNIQIGTVTTGTTSSVTRTGTNENPILNFTLVKGDTGEKGDTGATGPTGNGISTITKTSTSGLVDTYTITFTNGNTTTFDVTNGEDGEVTQTQLDETNAEVERAMMVYNALPKVEDEGTEITLNGTANCPMKLKLNPSELTQETTTGKNLMNITLAQLKTNNTSGTWSGDVYTSNGVTFTPVFNNDKLQYINANGTATGGSGLLNLTLNFELTDGQTYILNGCPEGGSETKYDLRVLQYYSGASHYEYDYGNGVTFTYNIASKNSNRYQIVVYTGTQVNNLKFYPMARLSSISDGTYEPYSGGMPQPNPDYPSEVQVIKGNNSILIHGRNIFNKNDYTKYTAYLDSSGSWLYSSSSASLRVAVQPNTTYTVSANNSNETIFRVASTTSNNAPTTQGSSVDVEQQVRKENTNTPITITTNANTKYLIVQFSNAQFDVSVQSLQVEVGDTAKPYQEYQGEQVLPLNLPVENLFDKDTATYALRKSKNDNGEEIDSNNFGYLNAYIPVKPNTKYTISGTIATSDGASDIYYYNSSKDWISRNGGFYSQNMPYTFTTPNNCYFMQFRFQRFVFDDSTVQIEEGDKANQYTPYGTSPIEYCKIGTYEDEFEHNGDKWYLNKFIGKVVLDENTGIGGRGYELTNSYRFYTDVMLPDSRNGISMSNYFKNDTVNNVNTIDSPALTVINKKQIILRINKTLASTVEELTNWLSTHNTEVYYVLETPTYEEITDTTLISQLNAIENAVSYDKQTNISQTNTGLPFRIKVSAVRSLANIFDMLEI